MITHKETTVLPADTQRALDEMKAARAAWLEAREKQSAAAGLEETVRQRRSETEATAKALNEEWRQLFRENQGAMTPRMKTLRAEIALGRETLDEFDVLLASHAKEADTLAQEMADRAKVYAGLHRRVVELHSLHLWKTFMSEHGQQMIQLLGLLKDTLGNHASSVSGVVHSINDPDTVLKDFISNNITRPALKKESTSCNDPLLRQIGMVPEQRASQDARKALSPAARHKRRVQRAARETAE